MPEPPRRWLVTLRLDPIRTCDVLVPGRSEWSAGRLARLLHPGVEVLVVRPAERGQGAP